MTPCEYLARIDELLSAGDDQGVLDLAGEFGPLVHPQLGIEDLSRVYGTLEGCIMAVNFDAAARAQESAERPARPR
jgi:hypothetical protein